MGRLEFLWGDSLRKVQACADLTLAIPHLETRGVYDILYTSVNGHDCPARTDAVAADPGVDDPWLFTDPAAWLLYAHQGRLEQLKQDILAYVMYEEQWAPDELQLKRETQRLLSANVVLPKGTFSYLSPHPTVYRADGDCLCAVAGAGILAQPHRARADCTAPKYRQLVLVL